MEESRLPPSLRQRGISWGRVQAIGEELLGRGLSARCAFPGGIEVVDVRAARRVRTSLGLVGDCGK